MTRVLALLIGLTTLVACATDATGTDGTGAGLPSDDDATEPTIVPEEMPVPADTAGTGAPVPVPAAPEPAPMTGAAGTAAPAPVPSEPPPSDDEPAPSGTAGTTGTAGTGAAGGPAPMAAGSGGGTAPAVHPARFCRVSSGQAYAGQVLGCDSYTRSAFNFLTIRWAVGVSNVGCSDFATHPCDAGAACMLLDSRAGQPVQTGVCL